MKFSGELNPAVQKRIDAANLLLNDPERLAALENTGLLNSRADEAFDRLAKLAAQILKVPLTIVSLVSEEKQFFMASYGMSAPMNVRREIPIDGSICRYALQNEPIIVGNASQDPFLMHHPATGPWGIGAFLAIPMRLASGHVLGAFCAVDPNPRPWSDEDIFVMHELTASVMAEINLRTYVSELEFEREVRDRFVMALSHDLRTPMTAAKLSAQLLQRKLKDSEKERTLSERIISNMDRADGMIRDLLDANRIKAGEGISLTIAEANLALIIEAAVDDLRDLHGPYFQILNRSGAIMGFWDGSYIRRAVENLISNAVKYGTAEALVTVTLEQLPAEISIAIHNFGEGISPEEQTSLFGRYRRSASASKGTKKGWGIGLTLVRGIAEAHGGSVDVTSGEGGTTFTLRLPLDSRKC